MCVSVCVCVYAGCPSQQLAPLNSVIEMTNRAAFFGFLQQLNLAILFFVLPMHGPLGPEIEFGFGYTPGAIPCW